MNFYLVFTFLIGLVVLFRWKGKGMGYILLFLLFFLSAFRGDHVGNDTLNYLDSHSIQYRGTVLADISELKFDDLGQKVELINNLVCKVIYDFNLDTRWLLYFYSVTSILFFALAIRRFKANLSFAAVFYVLLSIFFYSLSAARQICAVSVILYAYSFLRNKLEGKNIFFFVWIAVASFIHSFSIVCLVAYAVRFIPKLDKAIVHLLWLSCLFLLMVKVDIIQQLSFMMSIEHVESYYESFGKGEGLNIVGILFNAIYVSYMFYVYVKIDDSCKDESYRPLLNLFLIATIIFAAVANYDGLIGRVHYNFTITQCALLSLYYAGTFRKVSQNDLMIYLCFVLYCAYKNKGFIDSLTSNYYLNF